MIKKLLLVSLLIVFVQGCNTFSNTMKLHFDNAEFSSLVRMEVLSDMMVAQCDSVKEIRTQLFMLDSEASFLLTYTKYVHPEPYELHGIAVVLHDQVQELKKRYEGTPSKAYCESKLKLLNKGIERALKAAARKME